MKNIPPTKEDTVLIIYMLIAAGGVWWGIKEPQPLLTITSGLCLTLATVKLFLYRLQKNLIINTQSAHIVLDDKDIQLLDKQGTIETFDMISERKVNVYRTDRERINFMGNK